jgi:hypothetical protein
VKLGVVSLMRYEADIVGPFLQHLGGLFDHAVLMDHGSIDGIGPMLRAAARPGWQCWEVAVPGFHQAAFTGFAADHLLRTTDVDYVVLLDADEFLNVPDRAALEAAVAPLADNPRVVGHLPWRNCVPVHLDRAVGLSSPLWAAPATSPFCKVILPRAFWSATGGLARPGFGNHKILPGDGGRVDYHRVGEILHLPLRSLSQMKLKVLCGTIALDGNRQVPHWSALLQRIGAGTLTHEDLTGIAARYGETDEAASLPARDLRRAGFTRRRLRELAHDQARIPPPPMCDPLDQLAAALIRQPDAPQTTLVLSGRVLHWA